LLQSKRNKALQQERNKERGREALVKRTDKAPATPTLAPSVAQATSAPNKARKLSYKEQKELEELPTYIDRLEQELVNINRLLEDGSLYASEPERAVSLSARAMEIDDLLLKALERWELLGT
jgi:ATP-binding cassette subfamily F protein uup